MKQFQLVYDEKDAFREKILEIKDTYPDQKAMIQIFYDKSRDSELTDLFGVLDVYYPEVEYFGCASNANIKNGKIQEGTIEVIFSIFEDYDTKIKVLSYVLTDETQKAVCDDVLKKVSENPWVKGIELLITIRDMSTTYFCDRLSEMDENIQIFGGSSFNKNLDRNDVAVFTRSGGFIDSGVVFVFIGGENLHLRSTFISGWKPLGQNLLITKAEANRLYELNGSPAYDTYYHYLKIDNDEFFYHNALEFPIFYERNGINILRVPAGCTEDGSLIMTSDMTTGSVSQLSYGDPQTILKSIFTEAESLSDFVPDGILIFDCASRRSFWGSEDIDRESLPFNTIADTAGFYTAGEYHRFGKSLNQHNVTLVIVGMREGDRGKSNKSELLRKYNYNNEHISMVRRLANFIDVASNELDATNKKLELANEKLMKMAITDELTGVLNRREIQNRISHESGKGSNSYFSLIMLDLDNFKRINDTYGHDEGDRVLKKFSQTMMNISGDFDFTPSIGRWGGEEFMILIPYAGSDEAFKIAERIRLKFSEINFPNSGQHTVSCGVTAIKGGETSDEVCTRVDHALYQSKKSGRNRTSIV